MKCTMKYIIMFCFGLMCSILLAESFVIRKEKKKKPSVFKEQYAQKSGEIIKMLPKVQKHVSQVQRVLIDDMDALFHNNANSRIGRVTKEQLEARMNKISKFVENVQSFDEQLKELFFSLK
jgi:3-oxoacyl-[acyl-carrier-protein] synthase III